MCDPVRPTIYNSRLNLSHNPQVNWVLCVQESVLENVEARLKLRMAGMKCLALRSDEDRTLVDAAVREAQQQGATVSLNSQEKLLTVEQAHTISHLFTPRSLSVWSLVDTTLHSPPIWCPVSTHRALQGSPLLSVCGEPLSWTPAPSHDFQKQHGSRCYW